MLPFLTLIFNQVSNTETPLVKRLKCYKAKILSDYYPQAQSLSSDQGDTDTVSWVSVPSATFLYVYFYMSVPTNPANCLSFFF